MIIWQLEMQNSEDFGCSVKESLISFGLGNSSIYAFYWINQLFRAWRRYAAVKKCAIPLIIRGGAKILTYVSVLLEVY